MLTASFCRSSPPGGDAFEIDARRPCRNCGVHPYWSVSQIRPVQGGFRNNICEYPLIHHSNQLPYHFIQRSSALGCVAGHCLPVNGGSSRRIYTSQTGAVANVFEARHHGAVDRRCRGICLHRKVWDPRRSGSGGPLTESITASSGRRSGHFHPALRNGNQSLGKTSPAFIRLIYHSVGVLCRSRLPCTAAAVPLGTGNRRL